MLLAVVNLAGKASHCAKPISNVSAVANSSDSAGINAGAGKTVRFYVLPEGADVKQRLQLTCTLVEKAAQENLRTLILCADDDMAAALDELLWSFKPESFIPHSLLDDEMAKYANIWLAVPPARVNEADVIINLSLDPTPDIPRSCNRIFEIVTQHSDILNATRKRFAAYRQRGHEPQTHKL
ncbi:DNA polymerase III subunit chi [Cardiobacteriaceae bacterium TAE3-ERU3]|nr:DNA polymerase III subunit chi [Cardiobacteriaceae bacterium TAE3-ERU3]